MPLGCQGCVALRQRDRRRWRLLLLWLLLLRVLWRDAWRQLDIREQLVQRAGRPAGAGASAAVQCCFC